jgi:glyoxylase-like metal-dependent hydrolase (beta-lactamase superfamily II)
MRARVPTVAIILAATTLAASAVATAAGARTDRAVVTAAATALGGVDRVNAVKNITLVGYGHYAYMFGGGNITASPDAPQKYQAANDLKRIYDLQNGRFQQLERRNFLFPFAATFGHAYAPVNLILDGDVAYDIAPDGKVARAARWQDGILQLDGVHMRRMWMMNNPVVAVRAALDPATKVSSPRRQNGVSVVDVTLKEGDRFALAFSESSHLPAWVRWSNPQNDLGQVTFTTYFTGYTPYGGVLLPLGYKTTLDWRNIDYFKVWVDTYEVDSQITDLAASEAVRNAPEPVRPPPQIKATPVANGIWHLTPGGTTVFEFADHLALFELGGSPGQAKAVIEFARTLAPGKPVTQYIVSHAHFDHVAGFREAVAEGLTVYSRRGNEVILREMATHPAPDFPDDLQKNKKPLKFVPVDEHLRLSDSKMTLDIYWARSNTHMADAVFAYVPAEKVMVEGDIATAAYDYQFWPDNYMDDIEYYKLDVETLSPVHMDVMKQPQVIELLKGGVQRARERCASELAKGNYFPGCPIQSKRY